MGAAGGEVYKKGRVTGGGGGGKNPPPLLFSLPPARRRARVGRGHGADLETSILETALQAHVENVSGIIRCEQRNTPLVAGRVIASVQEFVHLFGDPLRFSRPS